MKRDTLDLICKIAPDSLTCLEERKKATKQNKVPNTFAPSTGNADGNKCMYRKECTPGHEMVQCVDAETGTKGYKCKQCSMKSYQPDTNRFGDRCKLRKICMGHFRDYEFYGSPTKDAICKCQLGYHFEINDQRACVPNTECEKGYGQTEYGRCEPCLPKDMYSDKKDNVQRCIQLTFCEKDGRCTLKKSNGTFDNVCSGKVADVSKCENITNGLPQTNGNGDSNIGLIVGSVVGGLLLFVCVILLFLCLRQRRKKERSRGQLRDRPLTKELLDRVMERIIERSGEDDAYCKKVFSASFREIEDRINNQIWSLAQKLYKDHYQAGMYEILVEKYKGKEHKYAINGYLEEWRQWKGEKPEAISDIFRSLKECSREDIVYEICNKFREGYPEVVLDAEEQLENGVVRKRSSEQNFFERTFGTFSFCTKKKRNNDDVDRQENPETKDKLLALEIQSREPEQETGNLTPQEAGVIFRDRPSPSAPVIDEFGNVQSDVAFHRTLSSPVQCSS